MVLYLVEVTLLYKRAFWEAVLCSWCNIPGGPKKWLSAQLIILNHIQVAQHRVSILYFPSLSVLNFWILLLDTVNVRPDQHKL